MKSINFALNQLTSLRYFVPIIIEAYNRGIESHIFVEASNKYNCPSKPKNWNEILDVARKYNVQTHNITEAVDYDGIFFFVENQGMSSIEKGKNKKFVVLTFAINFTTGQKRYEYIEKADHILMPSKFFADYYGTNYKKNLFLGSPKFDVVLEFDKIIDKYNLSRHSKKALVVFPKRRDVKKINMERIYTALKEQGYDILVKTRGKDPIANYNTIEVGIAGKTQPIKLSLRGDHYFEDESWHPHTTMELIHVSDLIINFGSCAIEEIVMANKPVIDFHVKSPSDALGNTEDLIGYAPLYDYDYAVRLKKGSTKNETMDAIKYLTTNDFTSEFKKAQEECLTSTDFNSSKAILDFFENDV